MVCSVFSINSALVYFANIVYTIWQMKEKHHDSYACAVISLGDSTCCLDLYQRIHAIVPASQGHE